MLKAMISRKCCEKVEEKFTCHEKLEENFCEINRHLGAFGLATVHQVATVIKTNNTENVWSAMVRWLHCHLSRTLSVDLDRIALDFNSQHGDGATLTRIICTVMVPG